MAMSLKDFVQNALVEIQTGIEAANTQLQTQGQRPFSLVHLHGSVPRSGTGYRGYRGDRLRREG